MNRKTIAALTLAALLAGCGGHAKSQSQLGNAPKRPVFDCQEDELMVWDDAPTKGACVNVEEFEHAVHAIAGHIPANDRDRQLARFVAVNMKGMDHGH